MVASAMVSGTSFPVISVTERDMHSFHVWNDVDRGFASTYCELTLENAAAMVQTTARTAG